MKENILNQKTSDYVAETSREYAVYVCDSRAIPSVTDGLKSSQRKMLWVIRNKRDKIKTISLAGEAISENLYVHGDSSASGAISLLAAPYVNNIPLLEGIGSFGTLVDPYAIGAPRYTYVRKTQFTEEVLYPDLMIVPLIENYDGSTLEPQTFLPLIPLVLLNCVSGIAVGWSTEILPRDLSSLIDHTIKILMGEKFEDIPPKYEYLNIITKKIEDQSWEFYPKIERKDSTTIVVNCLPPDLSLEKFKEKLDKLEEDEKIVEYSDLSAEHVKIEIKFKRGVLKEKSDDEIVSLLKCKTRKSERLVTLNFDQKSVVQWKNTYELMKAWCEWRLSFYKKRFEYLLNKNKKEWIYWKTIENLFKGNFLSKIKEIKNRKELVSVLQNYFPENCYSEEILEKICNIPLYKWNLEFLDEALEKISECEKKEKEWMEILNSEEKIKNVFINELKELKRKFPSRKAVVKE